MGISSSTQKTTSNQTSDQTGTTTPVIPDWISSSLGNYTGRIGSMLDADPYSFVAPTSPLQQQAFDNSSRLGLWGANNNTASQMAVNAGNMGASTVPGSNGYTAARGAASTYTPATLANPREAVANGYGASQAGAHQASEYMGGYKNPFEQSVVDTTLAGMDHNAAVQRAQMEAQGAKAGAFGGSRWGLQEGQFAADNAMNRAATEAQLRSAGFDRAAALGAGDASAFNQAGLFNAGAQNEAGQFGASALNSASLANQNASNQFGLTQAGWQNDAARYGADVNNQFNQDYLGRSDAAAQFGAAAANQTGQFNASQQEMGLARQLQAASQLNQYGNDYAGNTQRDLALMADLGNQQRGVEGAMRLAPLAQLQAGGSLFGATPFQMFTGQNINTNGTSNGTNTTTASPSLFEMLMKMGQSGANAYAAGAGGA